VTMSMSGEVQASQVEPRLEPRLEALYREHHTFVWSTLLRLGVPSASVDDACQDVFLIVFRKLGEFEGRSQIRTWLFSIARRVAFRHRRGQQRAARKSQALAAEPRRIQSLEELFEKKHAAGLVLQVLDTLDDDKRTAVVLHVLEGMSGPEIAQMLGLPVDTAYSRIKAGRRVLRSRLRALGVEDDPAVLDAARRQTRPSSDARRRVAALLAVRLGAAPAVASSIWKGVAAAAFLGVVGVAGARAVSQPRANTVVVDRTAPKDLPSAPVRAADVSPSSSAPAVPPQAVAVEPESQPKPAVVRSRGLPVAPSAVDRLREEVALIAAVKAALEAGRPADAMAGLDQHARDFSHGELALERRGYRAIALCRLGKETQGRGAGRIFIKAHPTAALAGRVRAACGLEKNVEHP